MSDNLEHCSLCGEPTGHAGAGEDSIFIETNEQIIGPLCHSCLDGIRQWILNDCGYDINRTEKDRQVAFYVEAITAKDKHIDEQDERVAALTAERDQLQQEIAAATRIIQTHQPGGSPPPGNWLILLGWVLQWHAEKIAVIGMDVLRLTDERDRLRQTIQEGLPTLKSILPSWSTCYCESCRAIRVLDSALAPQLAAEPEQNGRLPEVAPGVAQDYSGLPLNDPFDPKNWKQPPAEGKEGQAKL